jgi:hypothetical protein
MQYLVVKEWERYQHYKDRNPPWIKLHRELLTSNTWVTMDDASRVLAIAIMLLAAATGNRIPADPAYLMRVAYLNKKPDWSKLLQIGFIEIIGENEKTVADASTMLADASGLQADARPEKRREEKRREESIVHFEEFWSSYPRRQARRNAEAAYRSALGRASHGEILQGLKGYAFSPDPKFIPLAATWLNGDRWRDERPPDKPSDGGFQLRPLGVGG